MLWPKVIAAGTKYDETICLTDLLATAADITNTRLPDNGGEDSVTLLPYMSGDNKGALKEATVHYSINGSFAIRQGKWKLVLCADSGGWSPPSQKKGEDKGLSPIQLYDIETNLGEKNNVYAQHPGVVKHLTRLLESYVKNGRSTPGAPQENDVAVTIVKN
jgi:arylsulfatase A